MAKPSRSMPTTSRSMSAISPRTRTSAGSSCSSSSLPPRPSDADIKRALATMTDMGFLESDDHGSEFRQRQPLRHLPSQHTALGSGARGFALAGDDQHEGQSVGMRPPQKIPQHAMSAFLGHSMQVEPGVDFLSSARKLGTFA